MASEVKTNIISPATGTAVTVSGLNVGSDAAGDVLYNDGTDYTRLAKPGTPAGEVLTFATSATAPSWVAAVGGLFESYALFVDQKTLGTDAGTFTSGSWQTRDLNTTLANTDTTNITLGTNEFTLLAGNYFIEWTAPAYEVQGNQTRLYDVTGTAEIESGTSSQSSVVDAHGGFARVTPSSSNAYRIEHKCLVTKATNGFGFASDFSTEKYLMVKIYKES